jgi:glyoxylase-like metal-dependent hydrolase (beta-lactamase superfamily II)
VPNIQLVFSCYLIKHGDDYMVWDTGWGMSAGPVAPKTSLIDLLAQVNVKPEQIKYVGISHYHADHVGQVNSFCMCISHLAAHQPDIAPLRATRQTPIRSLGSKTKMIACYALREGY